MENMVTTKVNSKENKMEIKDSLSRTEWFNIKAPPIILKKLKSGYKYIVANGKPLLVHRLVWEEQYGSIPEGMDIHHKDGNKQNNKLENLECLTRKEHIQRHRKK